MSKAAHIGRGDKFRSVLLSRLFYYQPLANKRKSQLQGDGRRRDLTKLCLNRGEEDTRRQSLKKQQAPLGGRKRDG